MNRLFILFTLLIYPFGDLSSQPDFTVEVSTEYNDFIKGIIETSDDRYIAVGHSGDYWQPETYVSYICIIDMNGDTVFRQYHRPDTIFQFHKIIELPGSDYLLFGACGNAPVYDEDFMVMYLDSDFNIGWFKKYHFAGYNNYTNIIYSSDDSHYYILAAARNKQTDFQHSLLIKMDHGGDTVITRVFDNLGDSQHVGDIALSPSGDELWFFGIGFNSSAGGSRVIIDTSLNLLQSHLIQGSGEGLNMNAKWLNDTSILFAALYTHTGSYPQDDDIGFSITDTSFTNMDVKFYGFADTIDYPAWGTIFDYKDLDSIFFAGTHNLIFDFWPEWPSWIYFGQLDSNLDSRFEYFYGGDAYYQAFDILSTSDGGCLITATKYDYLLQDQENDIIMLKYNKEDLITHSSSFQNHEYLITVFPNPGQNYLNVNIDFDGAELDMYDMNGKLISSNELRSGINRLIMDDIRPGVYVYQITLNSIVLTKDKWIKK